MTMFTMAAQPQAAKRSPVKGCCTSLEDASRPRRTVHQLSHSRTPFTHADLADLANCPIVEAYAACLAALEQDEIRYLGVVTSRGSQFQGAMS